jgi:aminoglycoside phosphotransferase (APT) family kinase protein
VLRRPPLGHVVATAHDMAREYRVLHALAGSEVPVPRVDALCEDVEVNGAPFYVMERVEGRVLRSARDMVDLTPEDARRASIELIDVLARLHAVDYESVGLADFGRPDGFLARNVARWGKQWLANKTRELPQIDELARRLVAALPESGPAAIVHGDYRLDNTILAADDPGRIVAVLDWEMSTLGDPLTDVGLFLAYWANDGPAVGSSAAIAAVDGFLAADEIVDRYAAQSGRSVEHLDFYVVFATYKLAVILEGIHARFLMGKTLGEGFTDMGPVVVELADRALDLADRSPDRALHG